MAPLVVVLNGAIASGKSTTATVLAGLLEQRGLSVATIGLDELWLMSDHRRPPTGALVHWLRARRAAALLTDDFFASGLDCVVVEGPFFTQEERTAYLEHLTRRVQLRFVTLRIAFEESYRRTQLDQTRTKSRDRMWLAERHSLSTALLPPLTATDLLVDTDERSATETATVIVEGLTQDGAIGP